MENHDLEIKETLDKAKNIISLRYITVSLSLVFGGVAALAVKAFIPLFVGVILATIVLAYNFIGSYFLRSKISTENPNQIINISFILLLVDVFMLTGIVYLTGGILSPFTFIYLILPILMGLLAPEKSYFCLGIAFLILILYESLLAMQFYGIAPLFTVLRQGKEVYQDKNLFLSFRLIFPVSILTVLFYTNNLASHLAKGKLVREQEQEQFKIILKELKEFYKVATERELKIMELEKEIAKLKGRHAEPD
ncbi:MAG: hypothetical protein ABIH22_02675 [Candidatus Margulisiibacteriota bacterium]